MLSDRLSTFWAPLTLVTLAALGAATPGSAQVPAGVVAALEGIANLKWSGKPRAAKNKDL